MDEFSERSHVLVESRGYLNSDTIHGTSREDVRRRWDFLCNLWKLFIKKESTKRIPTNSYKKRKPLLHRLDGKVVYKEKGGRPDLKTTKKECDSTRSQKARLAYIKVVSLGSDSNTGSSTDTLS